MEGSALFPLLKIASTTVQPSILQLIRRCGEVQLASAHQQAAGAAD